MPTIPACPQCALENTYPDGDNFVCADCGHEWAMVAAVQDDDNVQAVVKDANGAVLNDGECVARFTVHRRVSASSSCPTTKAPQESASGGRPPKAGAYAGCVA